jgi:hypothetical protein
MDWASCVPWEDIKYLMLLRPNGKRVSLRYREGVQEYLEMEINHLHQPIFKRVAIITGPAAGLQINI